MPGMKKVPKRAFFSDVAAARRYSSSVAAATPQRRPDAPRPSPCATSIVRKPASSSAAQITAGVIRGKLKVDHVRAIAQGCVQNFYVLVHISRLSTLINFLHPLRVSLEALQDNVAALAMYSLVVFSSTQRFNTRGQK